MSTHITKQDKDSAPAGKHPENEYSEHQASDNVPVADDDEPLEEGIDPETADSDQQLEKDEAEAIDKSNIINDRTRGAKPNEGYREPDDNEGIPVDTE